ncbi:MAG: TlpA family protein disulfide reductase [Chloroflexi bacterium]|nr:TlpA family protein disulfide reductase [Chloroflexota bacterium]
MTQVTPNQPISDTEVYDAYADNAPAQAPAKNRMMTPFAIVVVVGVLLISAMVAWGIYRNEQEPLNDGPAPDFSLKTYDNQNIRLSDYKGKNVVVINFWQTNCPPCHEEAPMLVNVYNDYKDQGVVFIGVNAKDPDKLALDYIDQYDITYLNGLDVGDKIQGMYRTDGYPETIVVSLDGQVLVHYIGQPNETAFRRLLDQALEQS